MRQEPGQSPAPGRGAALLVMHRLYFISQTGSKGSKVRDAGSASEDGREGAKIIS